jgi:hypothetical protein
MERRHEKRAIPLSLARCQAPGLSVVIAPMSITMAQPDRPRKQTCNIAGSFSGPFDFA